MPNTAQLPDFRLEMYLGRWEFAARHHLTASDAQTLTVAELLALGTDEERDAFENLPLSYAPTWGSAGLREAIAQTYERIEPDDVLTFAGAEEAWGDHFEWQAPQGGCVCFPRLTTGEPTSSFCRALVKEAGVVLLPADVFASELAAVPDDRFRIGVGRLGAREALAAFDAWLQPG